VEADYMNPHLLAQRLLGRATCRIGARSRLTHTARIRNVAGDSDRIQIGCDTFVRGELMTLGNGKVMVGDWCYVGNDTRIWSAASIEIGNRVLISHSVNIFDNLTHPLQASLRHQQAREIFARGHPRGVPLGEEPIVIHDDAWICAGAFVMRGVTLGEGAIVAAGAVVTKDVPPFSIAAGNPAVVIRELSPDER
jgi:acetyltransferase-like isoleucine patch superfamily enzyme